MVLHNDAQGREFVLIGVGALREPRQILTRVQGGRRFSSNPNGVVARGLALRL